MEQTITQGGIVVVFAIMVIREILNHTKENKIRKSNNCISRSEYDKHKETVQYKDNCSEIVKRLDGRFDTVDEQLKDIKEILRERQ